MAQKRSRVVVAVEVALLAAAVAFIILLRVSQTVLAKAQRVVLPRGGALAMRGNPAQAHEDGLPPQPSAILTVPPRQMYAAFADQYRMRPDRRGQMACETLVLRWGQWRHGAAPGRFTVGVAATDGERVVLPLLRDGAVVRQAVLAGPTSFAQVQAALDDWVAAMEGSGNAPVPAPGGAAIDGRRIDEAVRLIDTVDPRYVVSGLAALERAWRDGARDARILRAAARGYATLLLTLHPDEMGVADPFAAEALAFLALCRRADPALSVAREEALLAMTMGYTAHAASVIERIPKEARSPEETVLDAYLRQDLLMLKRAGESDRGVLGPYLLARHYRDIGLWTEAKAASRALLERFPSLYPSAVEVIHSGDLGEAKVLTLLYPYEITEQIRTLVDPAALKGFPSWVALAPKIVTGKVMAFSEFEGLLSAWRPFGNDNAVRFVVDANRARGVFRALYADAVRFRFTLLFDQWNVRDAAGEFAETLAATDNTHPLVLQMRARVTADRGNRAGADRLYEQVILSEAAGIHQAYGAYTGLSDEMTKIRLLPAAVGRMDGRPENVFRAAWLLANAYNYDLSARYYAAGLAQDPRSCWAYGGLAHVRGSDAPLRDALRASPNNYRLLREAGEYLAEKKDAASKEAAERAFAAAQALAPSVASLARQRARVLGNLGRHGEAVTVLDAWMQRYGDDGLGTIVMNARKAQAYLKMGRPRDALRALGRDAESMQGTALAAAADIQEALGNIEAAGEYHRLAVERYPTNSATIADAASFLWRQGKPVDAADLIAAGRPSRKRFDRWYWHEFMSAFRDAPDDDIVRAVDALKARGATTDEIAFIAFRLHDAGRNAAGFRMIADLRDPTTMWDIERGVDAYHILREWKGKQAASEYLGKRIPPGLKGPLLIVLYKSGHYETILEEAGDPASYGIEHEEFVWLQKLLAWLALERKPAELGPGFDAHYRGAVADKYHAIGRYMLGLISRDALLDTVRAAKDRCEFAYYIGFSERLKGNFADAAQWYQLCKETRLQNNGELHWAADELSAWAHLGTDNRHRLMKDDVAERDKAWRQDVRGLTAM